MCNSQGHDLCNLQFKLHGIILGVKETKNIKFWQLHACIDKLHGMVSMHNLGICNMILSLLKTIKTNT